MAPAKHEFGKLSWRGYQAFNKSANTDARPPMIPIVVVWTNYTSTVQGRVVKLVPCENCSTEYVYVLEREGTGVGTSFYLMNEEGAESHAVSSAKDTLQQYLANDFDPVPCPVCGHYQKYMFPKLLETTSLWGVGAMVAVVLVGLFSFVGTLFWGMNYLQQPNDYALGRLGATGSVLAVVGLIGAGLLAAQRAQVRRFNPNAEDQENRIAKGKSRAVTRADFEAKQQQPTE